MMINTEPRLNSGNPHVYSNKRLHIYLDSRTIITTKLRLMSLLYRINANQEILVYFKSFQMTTILLCVEGRPGPGSGGPQLQLRDETVA